MSIESWAEGVFDALMDMGPLTESWRNEAIDGYLMARDNPKEYAFKLRMNQAIDASVNPVHIPPSAVSEDGEGRYVVFEGEVYRHARLPYPGTSVSFTSHANDPEHVCLSWEEGAETGAIRPKYIFTVRP